LLVLTNPEQLSVGNEETAVKVPTVIATTDPHITAIATTVSLPYLIDILYTCVQFYTHVHLYMHVCVNTHTHARVHVYKFICSTAIVTTALLPHKARCQDENNDGEDEGPPWFYPRNPLCLQGEIQSATKVVACLVCRGEKGERGGGDGVVVVVVAGVVAVVVMDGGSRDGGGADVGNCGRRWRWSSSSW
jgi:hypothetical protein